MDQQGKLLAAVSGVVPNTIPQTAQAGEYLGNYMATRQLAASAELAGDCLGVVKAASDPTTKVISRKRMHAAAIRSTRELPSACHILQQRWVKAHQYEQ